MVIIFFALKNYYHYKNIKINKLEILRVLTPTGTKIKMPPTFLKKISQNLDIN